MTAGRVLHTGALTAFARGNLYVAALLRWAVDGDVPVAVPTAALAQAWAASGEERHRLSLLMSLPVVTGVPLDKAAAQAVGELLAAAGQRDAVAGHCVYVSAEHGWPILTDDAATIRAIRASADVDEVP